MFPGRSRRPGEALTANDFARRGSLKHRTLYSVWVMPHSMLSGQSGAEIGRTVFIHMIHPTRILLTAAFGLIMSALSAHSANIPISYLPFNITAPGTYVVTSNLVCPAPETAITINGSVAGRIILDLGGYTVSTYPNTGSLVAGIVIQSNPANINITVRNGAVYGFWVGVDVNPNTAVPSPLYFSNIHLENVAFLFERLIGVSYNQIDSSTVNDCTFTGGVLTGIKDTYSPTGNRYSQNSFDIGHNTALEVLLASPAVLEHCQFDVPPAN